MQSIRLNESQQLRVLRCTELFDEMGRMQRKIDAINAEVKARIQSIYVEIEEEYTEDVSRWNGLSLNPKTMCCENTGKPYDDNVDTKFIALLKRLRDL